MIHEHWKLWSPPRNQRRESRSVRYGVAVVLPLVAGGLIYLRPALVDVPFFIFLGAVALSAANGGLAAGCVTTALSSLLVRLLLVEPIGGLRYFTDAEGMERMGAFVLVSLLVASAVAALRREKISAQQNEERYRVLVETASDAIVVIDGDGKILYVNPAGERTFGTSVAKLVGCNLSRLLPGESYGPHLQEMKRQLESADSRKKAVAVRLPGRHESGQPLLVEMTMGSFSRHGRSIFTAVFREVAPHAA